MMKLTLIILLLVGCSFSAFADKVPSELKNLQAIRAKKIKQIDDAYLKALEKLKVKYTKRGDLESANAVNNELVVFQKKPSVLTSPEQQTLVRAKVKCEEKFTRMRDEESFWPNATGKFHDVPDAYRGWMVSLRNKGEQAPLQFSVKEAGLVTLLASHQNSSALISDGWEEVTLIRTQAKGTSKVLEKYLNEGDYMLESDKGFGVRLLKK